MEFNHCQQPKPYIEFNTKKRIEAEKNNEKDGKALYELRNYAIYRKTRENLENRISVQLVKYENNIENVHQS